LPEDASPHIIELTGISSGSLYEVQTLTITAYSSNPDLIPHPIVNYSSPSLAGSLSIQPWANSFGTAVITVTINDGHLKNSQVWRSFAVTVQAVNDPPEISAVGRQESLEDTAIGPASFTIRDLETPAFNLEVNAFSSNPSLIDAGQIALSGTGTNRTLTFRALPNQFGTAAITLRVRDPEGGVADSTFTLEVFPVNDPPYFEPIADVVVEEGAAVHSVLLSGIHSGAANELDSLMVTAGSSETNLIRIAEVIYSTPESGALLLLSPAPGAIGTATITATIGDGQAENATFSRAFAVTIVNTPPVISAIPDQLIRRNHTSSPILFTVSDVGTPAADLQVAATSSNEGVVSLSGLRLAGFDNDRALIIDPANGRSGVSIITLTVTDGSASTSISFQVTVDAL
jgi:hypothetical protein